MVKRGNRDPYLYQTVKRGPILIIRGLILRPKPTARLRIGICSKNPPGVSLLPYHLDAVLYSNISLTAPEMRDIILCQLITWWVGGVYSLFPYLLYFHPISDTK